MLEPDIFKSIVKNAPLVSTDYAVMEKTADAVVVSMDAGWSDIGSWSSLWDVSEKDHDGNVTHGDVIVHALENPEKNILELIEVQSGTYLGEDDIVRFEDKYGRK